MAHKRFAGARSRGAAIGRSLAGGMKGTLIAGGTGAATFLVHDQAQKNIEFFGKQPWAAPALLLGVGHVMKQRRSLVTPGIAVCGAAGYALGNALSFIMSTKKAAAANKEATTGLQDQFDTGALLMPGDTGDPVGDPYAYDVPSMGYDTGALVQPGSVDRQPANASAAHSLGL
jgi:hypothetical protein